MSTRSFSRNFAKIFFAVSGFARVRSLAPTSRSLIKQNLPNFVKFAPRGSAESRLTFSILPLPPSSMSPNQPEEVPAASLVDVAPMLPRTASSVSPVDRIEEKERSQDEEGGEQLKKGVSSEAETVVEGEKEHHKLDDVHVVPKNNMVSLRSPLFPLRSSSADLFSFL